MNRLLRFGAPTILAVALACGTASEQDAPMENPLHVVEILTANMDFQAPDTIPSGWVTFRLINKSQMVHFALLERLPPGKTIKDHHAQVAPVFQNIMDGILGKEPSAPEAGFEVPPWFGDIVFTGGPGMVSSGHSTDVTVRIEPGIYLIECYVKTNGIFHSFNPNPEVQAMVHQFVVTSENSGLDEPVHDWEITVDTSRGIVAPASAQSGRSIVRVNFRNQKVYGNFVGHDLHIYRSGADTDLEALESWIDWTQPAGLQTPCPVEFVAGINEMPAGAYGYLTVDLEPGEYTLVAEVPAPSTESLVASIIIE